MLSGAGGLGLWVAGGMGAAQWSGCSVCMTTLSVAAQGPRPPVPPTHAAARSPVPCCPVPGNLPNSVRWALEVEAYSNRPPGPRAPQLTPLGPHRLGWGQGVTLNGETLSERDGEQHVQLCKQMRTCTSKPEPRASWFSKADPVGPQNCKDKRSLPQTRRTSTYIQTHTAQPQMNRKSGALSGGAVPGHRADPPHPHEGSCLLGPGGGGDGGQKRGSQRSAGAGGGAGVNRARQVGAGAGG